MTPFNLPPRRSRPHRRVVVGLAGVIAAIASFGVGGGNAAAGRIAGDHHSPTVVERALLALGAHDRFSVTGTPGDFVAYLAARDATADAVAVEIGLDPIDMRAAWARAGTQHQEAVLAALSQLGKPYRYATSDPDVGFDCSGLTAFAWSRAGVELPHQSGSQISAAASRDQDTAVAGDLAQYPGHVMMYLGVGDAIVHASNPSTDVALSLNSRSVRYGDPEG